MTDVSVLGLGSMGGAIAQHLAAIGRTLTVWNRTPERAEPFVGSGANLADSPRKALTASPVSIVVVDSYETISGWIEPMTSLRGHSIINVTTGSPDNARSLAEEVRQRGGNFLDLALFFYPDSVGSPASSLRASGSRSVWMEHFEMIGALAGDAVFVSEDVAQANVLDTVWISFYVPALTAAMEAMAYAISSGVEAGEAAAVLRTTLPVTDEFLVEASKRIEENRLESANPIELYRASLDIVRTTLNQDSNRARMADAACLLMEQIPGGPREALDFAALPKLLLERRPSDQ